MTVGIRGVLLCLAAVLVAPAGCDNSSGARPPKRPPPTGPGGTGNQPADNSALATGQRLEQLKGLIGTWELSRFLPPSGDHPLTAAGLTLEYQAITLDEDGTASAETWLTPPEGEPGPLSLEELGGICQPDAARRLVRDTLGPRVLSVGAWNATLRDNSLRIAFHWASDPADHSDDISLDALLEPAAGGSTRHKLRMGGNPVIAGGGVSAFARYD